MQLTAHVQQMAQYNQVMNQQVYHACASLSNEALNQDRGAFFHSILGTLNHLVVGDTLWLQRFFSAGIGLQALAPISQLPPPRSLDAVLFTELTELARRRELLDQGLLALSREVDEASLHRTITYKNSKGVPASKNLFSLVMHLFNHQTHHRGQVSTLLTQLDLDIGVTDLVVLLPDEESVGS
ncbi:DinB family protein [Motilimonas eburnea]|uniref:DinB family protein n=1 Tax=Motilimonas eburnea TaxID=1737488 RepID=UPI001E41BF69|nr:DinB family protein [Motilimonas eburnea]MCE2572368.1 DinB family protein [Motilimonas eburnea]